MIRSALMQLRGLWTAWAFAAMLPLPVLLAMSRQDNGVISCLYLGIASAWLATEIFRQGGLPESFASWSAKTLALSLAVVTNVALFILLGLSAGVRTNIPFPAMAAWSAVPALGLVPWLIIRLKEPYTTLVFAATLVGVIKLVGCVVARIVYGPDYIEQGYVAGDWRTAKLMISVLWILTVLLSLTLLTADFIRFKSAKRVATESPA
jgi:hypothetical protein